jgi:hypothetical protein
LGTSTRLVLCHSASFAVRLEAKILCNLGIMENASKPYEESTCYHLYPPM